MNIYRELFLMNQIYGTFFSLTNKIQIQGDKYYGDLTSRQFMTLISIAHLEEDESTLNNIARKLGTTKQSVKQLVTIIENKGYVVTVPSKQDKRAVNIKITEFGKEIMMKCAENGMSFLTDLFKDFSVEEMEILWLLLKKLYRFNGEEQDGFEEDASSKVGKQNDEIQARVLEEFTRRRSERR